MKKNTVRKTQKFNKTDHCVSKCLSLLNTFLSRQIDRDFPEVALSLSHLIIIEKLIRGTIDTIGNIQEIQLANLLART